MKRAQVCGEELHALAMGSCWTASAETVDAPKSSPGLLWQSNKSKVHFIRFSALLAKEMHPVFVNLCSRSVIMTRGSRGWLPTQPLGTGIGTVLGLRKWAFVEAEKSSATQESQWNSPSFSSDLRAHKYLLKSGSICRQWDKNQPAASPLLSSNNSQTKYGKLGLWMLGQWLSFSPEACEAGTEETLSVNHGLVKRCLRHLRA